MIEFSQVSAYGLISTCERYRIGKYIIHGKASYALWDGFECLGRYASASDAKKAAVSRQKEAPAISEGL